MPVELEPESDTLRVRPSMSATNTPRLEAADHRTRPGDATRQPEAFGSTPTRRAEQQPTSPAPVTDSEIEAGAGLDRAEPPLLRAMRAYLEGQPDQAIGALEPLKPDNQDFVLAVLPSLVSGATADLEGDPRAVAVLATQLRAVARRLEARAPLLVENLTLCRHVAGFGRYEPWPQGRPYRVSDTAQLYLEVRNLISQLHDGPNGETHLTAVQYAAVIRDAHGQAVEQPAPDDARRRVKTVRLERRVYSRGPVEDFHILYTFPVPSTPGVYTISLDLHDPTSGRTVRTPPYEFQVTAP